jgi:hypothetical protein
MAGPHHQTIIISYDPVNDSEEQPLRPELEVSRLTFGSLNFFTLSAPAEAKVCSVGCA